jgi:hypothetical protein
MKARLVCALAATCALIPAGNALAAPTTVKVTESDIARQAENTPPTRSWVFYTRTPTSTGVFRTGPASPPLGAGSFEISTPTGGDKGFLFNYDHVGTPLADIGQLGYSTYRTTGEAQQVVALNMEVDANGAAPGGFTTLVFEPVYNTAQGTVVDGQWQSWDADNGYWWSTRDIPGVCAFTCYVKWSDIVAANPDAVVAGGYGLNQGSGNPNLISAADALVFGDTTYDFERVPLTKDDCKNGGWQSYATFKNQGDCVSYVATGGKK